ncbi:MAG: hypothetical protein AAF479_01330 [Pseudomonadota bacterium]
MRLTRRNFSAAGLSALAGPALGASRRDVLFVGNSFTAEHNVPILFQQLAESFGYSVSTNAIIANGAFLADQIAEGALAKAAQSDANILILQDHSTAALSAENRAKSTNAFLRFGILPARKIIFETWPRQDGHPLLSKPGMPGSAREMVERTERHYLQLAPRIDADIARIGRAWMLADGISLHRGDRYHANLAGAWFAALILVRTAGLTASAPPYVPDGLSTLTAKRLYQIARMVAP